MLLKILTSKHSQFNADTTVGLFAVLVVMFLASRWLWRRALGAPSQQIMLLTEPKYSPLAFYRILGRLTGLAVTCFIANVVWIDGSPSSLMMGPWVVLTSRVISALTWLFFFIHCVGLLEDIMVLKKGSGNVKDFLRMGKTSRTVAVTQRFVWSQVLSGSRKAAFAQHFLWSRLVSFEEGGEEEI